MRRAWSRSARLARVCALGGALAFGLAGCERTSIEPEALLDPASCASCHPEQYAEWAGSMHAYSSDDPVFSALVTYGQRTTNGALASLCAGCHAPTAVAVGATVDGADMTGVPRYLHGVGCTACHTIDAVTALHNGGLHRADDGVMRGGIGDPVATPAHGSARTPLLAGAYNESSEACGACHDVQVGDAAIEATYAEWAGSVFGPTGPLPVSCTQCHMLGRDGVAAKLPGMPVRRLHDHGFPGIDQTLIPWPGKAEQEQGIARDLKSALSSKLCVGPAGGGVEVQVTLDNLQVGHAFPSGVTHSRRVWVEVAATTGAQTLMSSGHFAPGEVVSAANDPLLWRLGSKFRGADGSLVEVPWLAKVVESDLLLPTVTTDPLDPRYYHAKTRTYPVTGVPERVELTVHVEPIGLDVLDLLISTGDLAPEIRAAMPRRTLPTLSKTWRHADGFGCAP